MNPFNINASLLKVVAATITKVKSLNETVGRYKARDKALGRLQGGLNDLIKILMTLEEVANNEDPVLALLKYPVSRCGQVSREFEDAMTVFAKAKIGQKDWTKMEFMRGDINEFINTLAEYKSTITIGLGTITMSASRLTQQFVMDYNEMVKDTAYSLEIRLQRIDESLTTSLAAGHLTLPDHLNIDLEDEEAVIIQCLRTCERASSYIKSLQEGQYTLQREGPRHDAGYVLKQFKAQLLTQKTLNENRDSLIETISRLREHLESATLNRDPEREGEKLRLEEEINFSKQCLDVCKEASSQVSSPKINTIGEVVAEGECDHVMVTALADLFNVGTVKAARRSMQIVGSLSNDTIREIYRDRYGSRLHALGGSLGKLSLHPIHQEEIEDKRLNEQEPCKPKPHTNLETDRLQVSLDEAIGKPEHLKQRPSNQDLPDFSHFISRDTSTKSSFSKDSGYVSRVSKAHQPSSDQRHHVLGSGARAANYSSRFFDHGNERNFEPQIWTGTKVSNIKIPWVLWLTYMIGKAEEKALGIPIQEIIPAPYLQVPDLCKETGISTNCPCIFMSIEFGQWKVASEKRRYWAHLEDNDPNLKLIKLRKRNRIDQYVLRWKKAFCLETTEDYHILTHELRNKREGLTLQEKGRPKGLMATNDGQKVGYSTKWESESVASVKSVATSNTVSSVNPTAAGGAAEELAEMLVKDESICALIKDGYKYNQFDRFERNLQRILRNFAKNLRKEASNDLEKSAVHLIHNYRGFVIMRIKKYLELPDRQHSTSLHQLQTEKQTRLVLERFLESLPGAEEINAEDELEQNESRSEVNSDLSNDEQPHLSTLEKVKLYLMSSTAYSEFKQDLAEFVRPACITDHPPSDQPALLDFRSDKVFDVGDKDYTTEQNGVPATLSISKSDVSFPQSGPASIEDVEVVWSAVQFTTQQNEKEQRSLKRPESKHGGPKEGLQPSRLWINYSLKRFLLTLHNRWARWRRQPVADGRSRVEWTCACGHDLFADFHNKSPDMLKKYAIILQRPPNGDSHTTTSQPSTNYLASPPNAHLQPNSSSTSMQLPQDTNNLPSISASQSLSVAANNGRDPSFLELCINTGPHLKSLAEIDTRNISTDGALFQAIRKQYLNLRGFRSRFWLLKPAAVSFVRFSLEKRHRVGILQKPLALPPKSEVDAKNWIYEPCPLDGDPPIPEDLFLHYLQCIESSTSLLWMPRFPQRLETSLMKDAAVATFGWGIHIDEGPDFAAIFMANFLVLVLSGVAAGLWKIFERDFQGAFGFASWIVAVLNSLLMAYMFKWRQE